MQVDRCTYGHADSGKGTRKQAYIHSGWQTYRQTCRQVSRIIQACDAFSRNEHADIFTVRKKFMYSCKITILLAHAHDTIVMGHAACMRLRTT